MLMRRDRYRTIPESMLIWYGDEWLFNQQKHRNWVFGGFPILTRMEVTSGLPGFSLQKKADGVAFAKLETGRYTTRFAREDRLVFRISTLNSRIRGKLKDWKRGPRSKVC